MFDALKLLGSMAETQSAPSAGNRISTAMDRGGGGGLLQQIMTHLGGAGAGQGQGGGLGALLGGAARPGPASGGAFGPGGVPAGGLAGVLDSFARMTERAANAPGQEIRSNNPVAVGGLGTLAGALLGGGRGALGGGLLAVLGSLAYQAMQSQSAAAPASVAPAGEADLQRRAMLVLRAMIQAAKADGQVDPQETQRIMGKLDEHGQGAEARAFVADEMRRPIDIPALVRDVASPQEAAEIYAASLMAIEVDSQAERDYLDDLARALRLPPDAVGRIHSSLGMMSV